MTMVVFNAASVIATETLAARLSLWVKPGFVLALQGDLGAGKSTFARAFIRAVANNPELDVPSPTFSLLQSYDELRVPLAHVDLYRLSSAADVMELGLTELTSSHALLIEWPERMQGQVLSPHVLDVTLTGSGDSRDIEISASGGWEVALARDTALQEFLAGGPYKNYARRFLLGDASSRRYETLSSGGKLELLMDMPGRPDGPPIRHGKHYSALARLADTIESVVAINRHLHALGYSAPRVHASDLDHGFAVMEWLEGDVHGTMMLRGDNVTEPMLAAVDVLVDMARHTWPRVVEAGDGRLHRIPDFDLDALLIETDLLPSWFWPQLHGVAAPQSLHDSFEAEWRSLLPHVFAGPTMWVLRDFHSPNLIWMPQRHGLQCTGLIDTQDTVMGHAAYDVASLLQDARCDVAVDLQDHLYTAYIKRRSDAGGFDAAEFARSYAILGAQRASRLLGTFTRLSKRDGKHQYLKHRPRVARYLVQNLAHPELASLRRWYEINLPQVLALAQT
jgi:N-acetylmuramate 1-kinase